MGTKRVDLCEKRKWINWGSWGGRRCGGEGNISGGRGVGQGGVEGGFFRKKGFIRNVRVIGIRGMGEFVLKVGVFKKEFVGNMGWRGGLGGGIGG